MYPLEVVPSCPGSWCDQETGIAEGFRIWQPDYEAERVPCPYGCRERSEEEREEDRVKITEHDGVQIVTPGCGTLTLSSKHGKCLVVRPNKGDA